MATFFYSKINRDYLIWCVNILRIFTAEVKKFRSLVQETGGTSMEVHFAVSSQYVCKKMEHISDVVLSLTRKNQSFIKTMTALVNTQKKLKDIINQAKVSPGPLPMGVHEDEKCTNEKEVKANISEEKPPKENADEGKKNEGDSDEAKPLKEVSEEQKTNLNGTISEEEVEGDLKGEKHAEEEAGKPW